MSQGLYAVRDRRSGRWLTAWPASKGFVAVWVAATGPLSEIAGRWTRPVAACLAAVAGHFDSGVEAELVEV